MASHAPAQDIESTVAEEVQEIRAVGKRGFKSGTPKLDLSDPRQISKEVVMAIARRIEPGVIAEKIEELMNMTRPTKHGPACDVRAMEAGIKLYLSYVVGLPVQRQEIISVALDADSAVGLSERMKNSPALRSSLRKLLDEVERDPGKTENGTK